MPTCPCRKHRKPKRRIATSPSATKYIGAVLRGPGLLRSGPSSYPYPPKRLVKLSEKVHERAKRLTITRVYSYVDERLTTLG